jgi:hypothetical protein
MFARGRAIKLAEKSNHSPIRGAPQQIKLLSRPLVRDAEICATIARGRVRYLFVKVN